jgi:hypothetical protein
MRELRETILDKIGENQREIYDINLRFSEGKEDKEDYSLIDYHNGIIEGLEIVLHKISEMKQRKIWITWEIDDILTLDSTMDDELALMALQLADEIHDANIGINWDTLQESINIIKKQEK